MNTYILDSKKTNELKKQLETKQLGLIHFLRATGYKVGNEFFYLVLFKFSNTTFKMILQEKNKEYIVNRISCEKSYIVSPSKPEKNSASSVPIIISKPTATFELQTVVDFKLDVNEIIDICKKMSDSKLEFASINGYRNKSSFEKGLY